MKDIDATLDAAFGAVFGDTFRAAAEPDEKGGRTAARAPKDCQMQNITSIKPDKPSSLGFVAEGIQRFTPAKAAAVFRYARYEFNRDEKKAKQHVAALARMMRDGSWRDKGTIEFARLPDGTLTMIDGHHRMLAQEQSGRDVVWNVIIHDVPDEDAQKNLFWTFDTTLRKRSLANVLTGVNASENMGLNKSMSLALARAVAFIDNGMCPNVGQNSRTYTPGEQLALMSQWQGEAAIYQDCVDLAANALKTKLRSTQIAAAALVTFRAHPEKAEEFWHGLCADDGLRKGDPRKTLLDWMRDTHLAGTGLTSAAAAVGRAWSAWMTGKDLNSIRIGRQPVRIAGTSMVVRP